MRSIALAILFTCLLASPLLAADVTVALTGGDVTGAVRGQGTASVTALVTNTGEREITGVRIAVYYSTVDLAPPDPDSADWRIHEFVFEPPLQPAKSTSLRFIDENAAEYVLIEVRYAATGLGLSYNGRGATLEFPLESRSGVVYVATRDLVSLVGGGLSYDDKTYEVVLQRSGTELRFKGTGSAIKVNGHSATLGNAIIEIDGRTFLPLSEICARLEIDVTQDTAANSIVLSD